MGMDDNKGIIFTFVTYMRNAVFLWKIKRKHYYSQINALILRLVYHNYIYMHKYRGKNPDLDWICEFKNEPMLHQGIIFLGNSDSNLHIRKDHIQCKLPDVEGPKE